MRKFCLLVFSVFFHFISLHAQAGSWSIKTFGNGTCYDVVFPDTTYGWAVGDSGKIMRSTNGGLTWANQTSPTGKNLFGVYFLNRNTGFAVGAAGTVLKTTNSGANWISHPTTDVIPWKRVYFSDAQTGWLLSDTVSSRIHYTTDGGLSWNQIGPQIVPGIPAADMSFSSGINGWIVSDSILLHTTDGVNWTNMNNSYFVYLFGISFPSDSIGYLLHVYSDGSMDYSVIYTTADAGETWVQLPGSFPSIVLSSICFITPSEGWVSGDSLLRSGFIFAGGVGYHTTDAGMHWSRELLPDSHTSIKRIRFNDSGHGWFAGTSDSTGTQSRVIGKYSGPVTAVDDRETASPGVFSLGQNYPNPFNPSTTIHFSLSREQHIRLEIFDFCGKEIRLLVDGFRPPGAYSESFAGGDLASGVYYYRLQAGSSSLTKKMIFLK